ncbi:cytochrome P450 4C1-like [Periplaneta americana]|uniref:cytochrome P450 4C1-like n=1 Tax=Periplaneta americana TaxID=6978 RepID=UPI0037E8D221
MMELLIWILTVVLSLIGVLYILPRTGKKAQFLRMIEQIPGPKAYPIIGTALPLLVIKRNEIYTVFKKRIEENKPLFRAWSGPYAEVHLTKAEHMEVILKSSEHIEKNYVYNFVHEWLGTGLLTSTGKKWFTHRKMITPTFHFKILDSFVEVFAEKSEILVDKLKKEIGSKGFDVYPYITRCALDIICETAMGTPIFAQDDVDSDYVKAVYDMSEITIQRMIHPWLHPSFLFKFSKVGRRHDECLRVLHGFTNKVIRERKAQLQGAGNTTPSTSADEDAMLGKKRRKAFLDLLLESSIEGVKLSDEELREEVDTFMFEGHDTTSAGMCWTLFLLGLYPDVQEKVHKELDQIFQGSSRSPSMKDLNDMKYLEQVVKETMRLYPSVPLIGRKLNADCKIDDYIVPAGSHLVLNIFNVHLDPAHFPNPEKFDPDNFLPERIAKRHPYAYIPFSAGPRNCIGQKFALLEEKTVLSYILRNYNIQSLETREEIKPIVELVLRPENGVILTITPRQMTK